VEVVMEVLVLLGIANVANDAVESWRTGGIERIRFVGTEFGPYKQKRVAGES
jgi:hypothetical protein